MMQRRAIELYGIVQSVGFRPFVHRLANELGLKGFVQNEAGRLRIEIEGESDVLDRFCVALSQNPPPLARIESLSWKRQPAIGDGQFQIRPSSDNGRDQVFICPDVAVCCDCLVELYDPGNRRYRYPFINCTNCGPRLTIVTGAPYDRRCTTMTPFEMCAECRAEYEDPSNRRYHAEAIACPQCGPQLSIVQNGNEQAGLSDPLETFAGLLKQGCIGALKGLGGFHLACDAQNESAVLELRRRKQRDEKPFAVMVRDVEAARQLCEVNPMEQQLLSSPPAPIVLLKRREASAALQIAQAIAPGNPNLGVILPYTPLHHLLLDLVYPRPLVMTSGNVSDEPIAYHDEDAMRRLGCIADVFLMHDRSIHVRCDDSVTRVIAGYEAPIRRSRGYAPQPISLANQCPCPILAVGGQLKGTFSLGRDSQAFVSHHLGDLDQLEAYRAFERDIELYEELLAIQPACIAHDLHPDYASTRYAISRDLPRVAIQHHHAHLASCMAEHELSGEVIGVIFDGAGLGSDGAIWGGEFLIGDCSQFRRVAHLRYVGLPGGERVMREPWRMAVAHLVDAQVDSYPFDALESDFQIRTLKTLLERKINAPPTSSMGRLFDAVAAMTGLRQRVSYEGQAASELEWLASTCSADGSYAWGIPDVGLSPSSVEIDARPLIRKVAEDVVAGVPKPVIARQFHTSVVQLIRDICCRIRERMGLSRVVLSGGVFMNALLTSESQACLQADGFEVHCHRRVPANDGGLSLGQLAIASHIFGEERVHRV